MKRLIAWPRGAATDYRRADLRTIKRPLINIQMAFDSILSIFVFLPPSCHPSIPPRNGIIIISEA